MMDIDRRTATFLTLLAPLVAGSAASAAGAQQAPAGASAKVGSYMDLVPPSWKGKEQIGIVIYDHITALDVIGPHYFLGRLAGAEIHFVADSLRPVPSENGLILTPNATFETCPKDLDVLMTGGGTSGTLAAMRDPAMLAFLADRGSRAKWVTSVCTGSLLLGQAGLLHGYRATSHWLGRPFLKDFGAIEVDERVVFDRNRATGAGVSAGLDLALALIQKLRPLEFAQAMQLLAEYAPEPSLDSGTPDRAPAPVLTEVRSLTSGFVAGAGEMARAYSARKA
ncbi:DJ-1/PfpI family protein [Sphingomonas oligophenolica]|uniref:DJ-1/PfpI family protein n=1 Tax=Sphingomonas oligophenolica TaxID=301154 RepID=A0ABU9YC20_9SPHN